MNIHSYAKSPQRYADYNHAQIILPKVDYSLIMESRGMLCEPIVNDVIIISNKGAIAGISQSTFGINEWVQSGKNRFGINVASWNWIDRETRNTYTEEKKNQFPRLDSYCSVALEVTTFKLYDDKPFERVSSIVAKVTASLDENGKLVLDEESYDYNDPISLSISLKKEKSHINSGFRKDITGLYLLTRDFTATNVPEWLWVKAPAYDDIPNNRQQLEEAYLELWTTLKNKDGKAFKDLLAISAYENMMGNRLMEVSTEDEEDFFLQLNYNQDFFDNVEVKELDFSSFEPILYENGRLVTLSNNSHSSPILQYNGRAIVHYFAYINGKFRVVR
ncbi:hypothetical protein VQ643_15600 [Pseudomonas sp. F1_0610]|uniref:hypothetical protein n=1 Tax=Pseudomonas sp. F1_0610 TaxID=3114284 RepID=UPI0039C3595A